MKQQRFILSLLLICLFPLHSLAKSPAHCTPAWCQKTGVTLNSVETLICQHVELQLADQLLNQVYQEYRNLLRGEARKALIQAQSRWRIKERDILTNQQELLASILERVMELNYMVSVLKHP